MIHWGIIGAGSIAHRFAASLQHEQDAVLYAISGRNEEKLKSFQQEYPCQKIYVGHEYLLQDPNVDAVYIALPHVMHAEWAIKALRAGKAVLCEKPAVISADEMKKIAEVSRYENVLFMEAMKSRFEPAYQKAKELAVFGTIGKIQSVKAEICFVLPQEQYGKSYHTMPDGGGALLDCGCYCVNWINDLCKGDAAVEKVDAVIRDGVDYYDDALLKIGECMGEVICGFDRKSEPSAVITGTKGEIVIDVPHRPQVIHVHSNGCEKTLTLPYAVDDFFGQIHHFDTLLKEGKTESNIMPLDDSIRNAQLIELIQEGWNK